MPVAITLAAPTHTPREGRMFRTLLVTLLLLALSLGLRAQVAINTTGAPPAANAILDISSTNKGLLIPRMTRAQRIAIAAPPQGLMVYQTDSVTTDPKGLWYYDPATPIVGWKHVAWGPALWKLGGNAGTSAADFLGTLNNLPLLFWIANYERGRISANGELQLYHTGAPVGPTGLVHVEGAIKLKGGSVGDTEGTIRYTPGAGTVPNKFEGYVQNGDGSDPDINGWKQIDNNFGERKLQETPIPGASCQLPSSTTDPLTGPRPWPIPGPSAGPFGQLTGASSPYYGFWEDSRRQYLFLASDLNAAGICGGSGNPIQAIAFEVVALHSGPGRLHFLRYRMKNTSDMAITNFDNSGWITFAQPSPPDIAGPPERYTDHNTGFNAVSGWNVHNGTPFVWSGNNLKIDAALDNQTWSSLWNSSVRSYNTTYNSMISNYCDACGGTGAGTCTWQTPVAPPFYFPPTTPTNGMIGTNSNTPDWGWVSGWNMTESTNTITCDGTVPTYNSGSPVSILNRLPRVAFYTKYTGSGASYRVGSYMYAQEGLMVGDAAWAASGTYPNNPFKGPGTITAKRSVWSGTTLLTDYVFDLYYDGVAKPEDAVGASQYVRTPLKELPNYVERERRLPNVDGRDEWNKSGIFSVDKLGNQLWVTVEDQALYIQELNARMDALKQFLVEKKLKELEGDQ
ncbi:MAG: hypothetical protein KF843_08705 [Flavobacteriales bacterium]|nr:hypothetical protein [Flavobacteriales bacterium]